MLNVTIQLPNPNEVLATGAFGAGALLRWESSSALDGTYTEGGTIAIVADQNLYLFADASGTPSTWYRWRVSSADDAEVPKYGAYSTPFEAASAEVYMTLGQLKAFVPSWLGDSEMLVLLKSSAKDIIKTVGPTGRVTEVIGRATGPLAQLTKTALAIVSVVEDVYRAPVTLAPDDYELSTTGQVLRRLRGGTHPSSCWRGKVRVTYDQPDDLASRQRVTVELVKLSIAYSGYATETTQNESRSQLPDYWSSREAVLATLTYPGDDAF